MLAQPLQAQHFWHIGPRIYILPKLFANTLLIMTFSRQPVMRMLHGGIAGSGDCANAA
jgi:hypothetical protein